MKYAISFKYRFELLIPLLDNEGHPFEPEKILSVHDKLLERFGGCRMEPLRPHKGILLFLLIKLFFLKEKFGWLMD